MASAATKIVRARRNGIKMPIRAWNVSQKVGVPYAVTCAILEQETGGGRNVFGHDPTIFVGAGQVTKEKYLAYKKARQASGNRLMQGVGPMQLTFYTFQDSADLLGGCWVPTHNMRIGLELLKSLHNQTGSWHETFRAYNGSEAYADQVSEKLRKWEKIFR